MLESFMTSFIEIAQLESGQKSGEIWLEGERRETRHPQPISGKIQNPDKTEVFIPLKKPKGRKSFDP